MKVTFDELGGIDEADGTLNDLIKWVGEKGRLQCRESWGV